MGDVPEFDNEFGVRDDSEDPQYFLFLNGDRKCYKSNNAKNLVYLALLIVLPLGHLDFRGYREESVQRLCHRVGSQHIPQLPSKAPQLQPIRDVLQPDL